MEIHFLISAEKTKIKIRAYTIFEFAPKKASFFSFARLKNQSKTK